MIHRNEKNISFFTGAVCVTCETPMTKQIINSNSGVCKFCGWKNPDSSSSAQTKTIRYRKTILSEGTDHPRWKFWLTNKKEECKIENYDRLGSNLNRIKKIFITILRKNKFSPYDGDTASQKASSPNNEWITFGRR